MRILFDNGTPAPLRRYLAGHTVDTAAERGWQQLENGVLLDQVERHGYEVLITTDQNMRYQQNLSGRNFAVIVLMRARWSLVQQWIDQIVELIDDIRPGEFREVPAGRTSWRDNGHN